MKNKIELSLILLFFLVSNNLFSQYIIVTFSMDRNKDNHGIKEFHWIIPYDSLKSKNEYSISPIYLDEFSSSNREDCSYGKFVDIFTLTERNNYTLDGTNLNELNNLSIIITSKRKKIQTITKKWLNGYKEIVSVYVTPVKGKFFNCRIATQSGKLIKYDGLIYFPSSGFEFTNDFWQSKKFKDLILIDFSNIYFKNIPG